MVKVYKYGDESSLSPHFSVSEFQCKCGKPHAIHIDETLVSKLEKLFDKLECSKIILNSGFRCATHDVAVGGNGSGNHTKGIAADIVCYDKAGSVICSDDVCCAAQDVGFTGIANIDDTRTATHVDVRTNGKWFGDETITTSSSVTDDFYKYFKKESEDEKKETIKVSLIIGDDKYEGTINLIK